MAPTAGTAGRRCGDQRRVAGGDQREWIEDEADKANADELADFIRNQLLPYYRKEENQVRHQPAIRAQTLGEGLPVHRLEKLNRYETHLDRKFERTLAMLVKLRELR